MNNKKILYLCQGAIISALYIVLNYTQELLLPGSTSMMIQVRLAESLCILCLFTPSAIWGLTVGCFASNLMTVGVLPLDIILGTTATFLAAFFAYRLRDIRLFSLPVLSSFMPVILNAVIIGLELEIFLIDGPFHIGSFLINAGAVALGEFIACVIIGLPFYKLLCRLNIFKQ